MSVARDPAREAVVYQIYPRSFDDSDGDGVGDLRGVVERLDYLDDLGVDVVWLNPVYDSPLVDNGYDVRDYRAILDEYGEMGDWEAVRDGLHERGMGLLMDLVVNHTSDQHEWFRRSRRGESPYDDYYVWRDGPPDEPPNNWESFFGGSAWSYDDGREAWYLCLFDDAQPDLDWSNPAVREEIYEMMRWWLEKDLDGFRMDVVNVLSKREGLPDGAADTDGLTGSEHFVDGPRLHEYLREMHDRVLSEYDVMTVGETVDVTPEQVSRFVADGLDMVFPFEHVTLDRGERYWDVREVGVDEVRDLAGRWQRDVGDGWIGLYLGNHDQPRPVSRFGSEAYRYESATMLATLTFTLRGTPFVYQGEEIGMTNATFERLDEYRDPATVERVELALQSGDLEAFEAVREAVNFRSRDNARTPMQWSDAPNAGFTTGEPWIQVNENYPEVNVAAERERDRSVLNYYRRLVELRKEHLVLVYGEYESLWAGDSEILAYLRTLDADGRTLDGDGRALDGDGRVVDDGRTLDADDPALDGSRRVLVVLNVSDGEPRVTLPEEVECDDATLLLGNYGSPDEDGPDGVTLRPYEARVFALE